MSAPPDGRTAPPFPAWFALLPLVVSAAVRGWWAPDEPRYAQVARDAIEGGHWLVLRRCGELYPDKPPLLFWLAGWIGRATDWNEFAMRAPSLLAMVALAAATAAFARRWWGRAEAAWAPLLLLTMALVAEIGGRLQLDPLLAASTATALFVASAQRGSLLARSAVAGALAGAAALVKGPVAWVLVGAPLAAWAWMDRRSGSAVPRRARVLSIVVGSALALLPVLTWASAAVHAEPSLARPLFFGQHIERAAVGMTHAAPPWKHLLRVPLMSMPWAPLVALAILDAWRARTSGGDRGTLRALAWFGVLFVFFSLITEKRDLYLLPAYPALALLSARALVTRIERGLPRWTLVPAIAATGAFALAFVAVEFVPLPDGMPSFGGAGAAVGAVLAACVAVAVARMRGGASAPAVRATVVGWSLALLGVAAVAAPRVDAIKSARAIGAVLAARPESPVEVPAYGMQPEAYRFYGRKPVVAAPEAEFSDGRFADRLRSEGAAFLALVRDDVWERATAAGWGRTCDVLAAHRVGSRNVLLVGRSVDGVLVAAGDTGRSAAVATER